MRVIEESGSWSSESVYVGNSSDELRWRSRTRAKPSQIAGAFSDGRVGSPFQGTQTARSPGVPSLTFFRMSIHVPMDAPKNVKGGSHGQHPFGLLFRLRGRPPAHHRRGRSPPIISLATTPMVRRWVAAGGPEGRGSGPRSSCEIVHRVTEIWRPPGVPSLMFFTHGRPVNRWRSEKRQRGQPRGGLCGAAIPAAREAGGASSAWSQPSNHLSRDRVDGATLGRRRRPRRPGQQVARSHAPPTWFSRRDFPREPPLALFGIRGVPDLGDLPPEQ